jgi:hypothetical protein
MCEKITNIHIKNSKNWIKLLKNKTILYSTYVLVWNKEEQVLLSYARILNYGMGAPPKLRNQLPEFISLMIASG